MPLSFPGPEKTKHMSFGAKAYGKRTGTVAGNNDLSTISLHLTPTLYGHALICLLSPYISESDVR